MNADSGLAVTIVLVMVLIIVVPAMILFFVARKLGWPMWAHFALMPVGFAVGAALTFFVVFDDLGKAYFAKRAAPIIALRVPADFRGNLYVYFDPNQPPLAPLGPKRYRIDVPPNGRALVGHFEQLERVLDYAQVRVIEPDGRTVTFQAGSPSTGNVDGAPSVRFKKFFIGTEQEYDTDRQSRETAGTRFDEERVYKELVRR